MNISHLLRLAVGTVLVAAAVVPDAQAQLRTTVYASGFTNPLGFIQDPLDARVQFVIQQNGHIRTVRSGAVLPADFLDLSASISSGGERGLLGLAFPPDAEASGRFFVNFTDPAGNTVVARFRRSNDPLIADPGSRFDLRWGGAGGPAFIRQPFSNHNGGNLVFGPDGFLYIGRETARLGQEISAAATGETIESTDEHGDVKSKHDVKQVREVELGIYNITRFNPATNTTLAIDFELYGTVLASDATEFDHEFENSRARIREQVTMTLHGATSADLTDAGLGLIKRRILEKTNRALGQPLLKEVLFSKFSFVER